MMMQNIRNVVRKIRKSRFPYSPLIEITIDSKRLVSNLTFYQNTFQSCQIAPVLKSNAYGHGLVPVASILDSWHTPFFVIDSYFEALMLRNEGIKTPLLVIGYTPMETMIKSNLKNVSFTISDREQLKKLCTNLKKPYSFHLKIDTGMHRQGVGVKELERVLAMIASHKTIYLEGVCTHLADSDTQNSNITKRQIHLWNACVASVQKMLPECTFFHVAATAGVSLSSDILANVIRLGIGLYGIDPIRTHSEKLKPVLEMKTAISSIRVVQAQEIIGYNGTYTTKEEMIIATIPVGYYEGLDRRLSNKGFCVVNGVVCPIVGRISMNMTTLDVTHVLNVSDGMPVVVLSNDSTTPNSIENSARLCDTIPYDLLVHIPQHLRRVVI